MVSWISCNNSSVGCEFTSIAADDETELEFKADQCIIDFAQDKHDALESCAQNSHHRVVPKPHLRKNNNYSKLTRRFTGKGPKVWEQASTFAPGGGILPEKNQAIPGRGAWEKIYGDTSRLLRCHWMDI